MDCFNSKFALQVRTQPDFPAISEDKTQLTYAELDSVIDTIAAQVAAHSPGTGRLIGYLGLSLALRTAAFVGVVKAGHGFVILNPKNTVDVLAGTASHAGLDAIIVDCAETAKIAAELNYPVLSIDNVIARADDAIPFAPVAADPNDIAYIVYISGSTDRPKGVAITRAALNHEINLEIRVSKIDGTDRVAMLGQIWPECFFAGLKVGATFECFDFGKHGAVPMADWVRKRQVTHIAAYPAMFRALAAATPGSMPSIRRFYVIGEPLRRADAEAFECLCLPGSELLNLYGSSEYPIMAGFTFNHGDPMDWETMPMGQPQEEGALRLLDEHGNDVAQGDIGQIVYAAAHVPRSYHRETERSKVTFRTAPGRPDVMAYHTGDYAFRDFNGVLQTAGRTDDQVKVRGYTIRLSDIEQAMLDHPGVQQVAVAGYPGSYGTQLAAHIVPATGTTLDDDALRSYLADLTPAYMVPGIFVQYESLPTTSSGKIVRRLLPSPLAAKTSTRRGLDSARGETECELADIWQQILGHADFSRHDDFFDLGGDSLQAMALLTQAEKRFDVRIPLEALVLDGATIAKFAAKIKAALNATSSDTPVTLGRGGHGTPLFAAHVIGGHLSDYLEMAHAFDGVRPVLGINPRGLNRSTTPDARIEDIATHGARVIRSAAGDGPHNLIGFSAGGSFALEMTRRLAEDEDRQPTLILLDSTCEWLDHARWVRNAWLSVKGGKPALGARRLLGGVAATLGHSLGPKNVDEAHLQALFDHRPKPLFLPRSLLVTADGGLAKAEHQAEWRRLLGPGLQIITVPGDHMSMIRAPHANALAQRIEEWLSQKPVSTQSPNGFSSHLAAGTKLPTTLECV